MSIIVIIVCILLMFYGLKVMDKIDKFLENNINDKETEYGILIYGDEEYTHKLERILSGRSIKYKVITDSLIEKNENYNEYKCIAAVSKEDLNNLMACRIISKYYDINNTYSVCNDDKNKAVYDRYDIHIIKKEEILKDEFISVIREKLKNEQI